MSQFLKLILPISSFQAASARDCACVLPWHREVQELEPYVQGLAAVAQHPECQPRDRYLWREVCRWSGRNSEKPRHLGLQPVVGPGETCGLGHLPARLWMSPASSEGPRTSSVSRRCRLQPAARVHAGHLGLGHVQGQLQAVDLCQIRGPEDMWPQIWLGVVQHCPRHRISPATAPRGHCQVWKKYSMRNPEKYEILNFRWIHPVEARPGLWAEHRPQANNFIANLWLLQGAILLFLLIFRTKMWNKF